MREGNPSPRFGVRGLHFINTGCANTPLLAKLYSPNDEVLATLAEVKGECIDADYVDFFLGFHCRNSKYQKYLIEKLPNGATTVLHDNPEALARNMPEWIVFLDTWVTKHEIKLKQGNITA